MRRRATSKPKHQLVIDWLSLDLRGISGFVEQFTEAVDVGQFGGTALDEGAVARGGARPTPRADATVPVLEGLGCARPRTARLVVAGNHDRAARQGVDDLVAAHRIPDRERSAGREGRHQADLTASHAAPRAASGNSALQGIGEYTNDLAARLECSVHRLTVDAACGAGNDG